MYLVSIDEELRNRWPEMAAQIAPAIGMQPEDIYGDMVMMHVFSAIVAVHYYDLSKLFDDKVTASLRRCIWDEVNKEEYSFGFTLREYFNTMKAVGKEGDLYLSVATSLLYDKLGSNIVIRLGDDKKANLMAILIKEVFMGFDLEWWKKLNKKYKVRL